jgi:hypothetical protein
MKDAFVIAILALVAIAVGLVLYFSVPTLFKDSEGTVSFKELTSGQNATQEPQRANYRIRSQAEFEALWYHLYGTDQPGVENIDFTKQEVLAVFDGTHSTGGYTVKVSKVEDTPLIRTVTIEHVAPDPSCTVSESISAPYQIIVLPILKQGNTLTHTDIESVIRCP